MKQFKIYKTILCHKIEIVFCFASFVSLRERPPMAIKMCSFCLERDHYVRNNTIITCPKLLANKCNHCLKFGHTTNFCKEKNRQPHCDPRSEKATSTPKATSRYAILELLEANDCELEKSDCEEEVEELENISLNDDSDDSDDSDELPPVSAIVWGKGFACKKKKQWSDY